MIVASNPHEAVSAFWASFLVEPGIHDNGASDIGSAFAGALANVLANEGTPPTEDEVGAFRAAIHAASKVGTHIIDVDYDPDRTLTAALAAAGLDRLRRRFPWKTFTWVRDGVVYARCGYANPQVEIWPNDARTPATTETP